MAGNGHTTDEIAQHEAEASPSLSTKAQVTALVAAGAAAGKTVLGTGQIIAQLTNSSLGTPGPIAGMVLSGPAGIGFYRENAIDGVVHWPLVLHSLLCQPRRKELLLDRPLPDRVRKRTACSITLGSATYALTQALVVYQGGGSNKATAIAFAVIVGAGNLVIGPANMAKVLGRWGLLTDEERRLLDTPSEEAHRSCRATLLIDAYAFVATIPYIIPTAGGILELMIAPNTSPEASAPARGIAIGASLAVGTLFSAVAYGINLNGASQTGKEVTQAGGWCNFLCRNSNLFFLAYVAAFNAWPSMQLGVVGSSEATVAMEGYMNPAQNTTLIPFNTMIRDREIPVDAGNITAVTTGAIVLAVSIAANTFNKASPARVLLGQVSGLITTASERVGLTACLSATGAGIRTAFSFLGCSRRRGDATDYTAIAADGAAPSPIDL